MPFSDYVTSQVGIENNGLNVKFAAKTEETRNLKFAFQQISWSPQKHVR
jgi:hypothetical protein